MDKDEEENSSIFQAKPSSLGSWDLASGYAVEERRGTGRDGDEGSDELSAEMVSHTPSRTTTSPRWITRLKSEQGDTLPPPHLLGPRENESGLKLLGVSTELHSFLAGQWKAWEGYHPVPKLLTSTLRG